MNLMTWRAATSGPVEMRFSSRQAGGVSRGAHPHIRANRRRSAFPITETELKLIAAAAMMGLRRMPKAGYSAPAATGIPMTL